MIQRLVKVALALSVTLVACGGGGAAFDTEAAQAEIKANWEQFFDAAEPVEPKIGLLEDGENLREIIEASAANTELIGELRAEVTEISFAEDEVTAKVKFDLFNGGDVLLEGVDGEARLIGGTWVVGRSLFCDLQALANNFCPDEE